MIDFLHQRRAGLGYHARALRREFDDWRARSDGPKKPFAKHQSQIARITTVLEAFLDTIDPAAVDFGPQETAYGRLLGVYRIWSYFRSKFMIRADDRLGDILRCADELAWACYAPAREKARQAGRIDVERLKEPPLVFFSSDATPFAQARSTPFMPEGLTDRDLVTFAGLILSLPVPVVGVPWFQLNHLPALPVVAHEVGHGVERDFEITEPLETLFGGLDVPPDRRAAWTSWRREVFADVYACLSMGPGFVLALADYLLGDREEVQKEARRADDWGAYPTRTLRILLNLQTLEDMELGIHTGKPDQLGPFLTALKKAWSTTYPEHRMKSFEDDLTRVARALLDARFDAFGGARLREVVAYTPADLVESWYLSDDVLGNSDFPPEARAHSFRVLAAAPALAHARDPEGYAGIDAQAAVLASLLAAIPEGVRDADPDADPALTDRKLNADRAAGRNLAAFFPELVAEVPQTQENPDVD